MTVSAENIPARTARPVRDDTFLRHARIDRLFHWLTATCVLTLMATGLLPHMGLTFDGTLVHWITGLGLTALVLFHLGRSFFWKKVRTIWFTRAELQSKQLGKYSVAQKCMHHALALLVFTSMCTGLVLLKKIGIPWLPRNPDMLGLRAWGWLYVIHGLAAVSAVTLVMIHIYFGVIPENRMYLKAMINGRMSRTDQRARVTAVLRRGVQ